LGFPIGEPFDEFAGDTLLELDLVAAGNIALSSALRQYTDAAKGPEKEGRRMDEDRAMDTYVAEIQGEAVVQ
jgi:hypothetical protein